MNTWNEIFSANLGKIMAIQIDAKDFADIVVRCIQQFTLNHKLFVESFLEWNKTKYKWKENTLIADFGNSQKLEIDFEEKSGLARIINIRLNS